MPPPLANVRTLTAQKPVRSLAPNPWRHTADIAPEVMPSRFVPGLPVNRAVATKTRNRLGATLTDLQSPREPAPILAANAPSVKMEQLPGGGVSVTLTRRITGMAALDIQRLVASLWMHLRQIKAQAEAMSRGPLKAKALRALGHPYGRENGGIGRKVPRQGKRGRKGVSVGHVAGQRGSVPTLSVVNIQSGEFARAWATSLNITANTITLMLTNSMPYAWYLAAGTVKMQAHGPFTYAMTTGARGVDSDIRREISSAYHRRMAQEAAERSVLRARN